MDKNVENHGRKDQTLQGCHYDIMGIWDLKLLCGYPEGLYFVKMNVAVLVLKTQRTLMNRFIKFLQLGPLKANQFQKGYFKDYYLFLGQSGL